MQGPRVTTRQWWDRGCLGHSDVRPVLVVSGWLAVILLIEHQGSGGARKGESSEKGGSYGLILNRRAEMELSRAVKGGLYPDFFKAFAHNAARMGGPVRHLVGQSASKRAGQ